MTKRSSSATSLVFRAGQGPPPSDIRDVFLKLNIPPPSNISQHLSSLRKAQLVLQRSTATWAVTPLGSERIRQLMAGIPDDQLASLGVAPAEPFFGAAPHHLIPPTFAPAQFEAGIGRFLDGHPFDQNIFGMSRFPRNGGAPVGGALEAIRDVCKGRGFELHLASDRSVEDLLFGNVAAALWASRYGIALLENTTGAGLNYNVVLEVGAMLVTGRRCLLLKDATVDRLPTDLVGHIYQSVNVRDAASVREAVGRWLRSDLGL